MLQKISGAHCIAHNRMSQTDHTKKKCREKSGFEFAPILRDGPTRSQDPAAENLSRSPASEPPNTKLAPASSMSALLPRATGEQTSRTGREVPLSGLGRRLSLLTIRLRCKRHVQRLWRAPRERSYP